MSVANTTLNQALKKMLSQKKLFYVTRDIERAEAGLYLKSKNYQIITNKSFWSNKLKKIYPNNIHQVSNEKILNTSELLLHSKTKKLIKENDFVLVFKPTIKIEEICQKQKWQLLNPSAKLANLIEEKISQFFWLEELTKYLPKTKIKLLKEVKYNNKEFILQFNRAHTGNGTILINSQKILNELKNKFPLREVRVVEYIKGASFTINCIVLDKKVILGNISYQITGLSPFTINSFATIGNDWSLPQKVLSLKTQKEIQNIANRIGKKFIKNKWQGLFGIDIMLDEKSKQVYLIEINARQPASTSFESFLQLQKNSKANTIFNLHLASLLNIKDCYQKQDINFGAQIVQRVTPLTLKKSLQIKNIKTNWRYIFYKNTEIGSDLIRLQSKIGIMENYTKLNQHGNNLLEFIDKVLKENK